MQSKTLRALTMGILLVFSALAGCIDADDNDATTGEYGTIMVSTYHVYELVTAITGDTIDVEMISSTNIPVHDFTPTQQDQVRLADSDLFFYHGLGLEPWVEATIAGLGNDMPTHYSTHSLPDGETDLDLVVWE